MTSLNILLANLDYIFKDAALLTAALNHPSCKVGRGASAFERLEFLGDRVLGIVIAELLYKQFPKEKEGELARRFATLVSHHACTLVAHEINLESHLSLIANEIGSKSSILCDAMEALIGAIYLDGGLEAARNLILRYWTPLIQKLKLPPKDPKSALQEWAQKNGYPIPNYGIVQTSGSAHEPVFMIQVSAGKNLTAYGRGPSRREAEKQAAEKLLQEMKKND